MAAGVAAPVAGHLYHLLKLYLGGSTVGRPVISPSDVRRGDRTRNRVQPDVFVVRRVEGKLPRYPFAMSDLLLAVEVPSPNEASRPAGWVRSRLAKRK